MDSHQHLIFQKMSAHFLHFLKTGRGGSATVYFLMFQICFFGPEAGVPMPPRVLTNRVDLQGCSSFSATLSTCRHKRIKQKDNDACPLMAGRRDKAGAATPVTEQVLRKWSLLLGPQTCQLDKTVLDLTRRETWGCSAVPVRCPPRGGYL